MLKNRRRLTPHTLGLIFLIPGLIWGVFSLITGTFSGAAMGFCMVAVIGGLLLMFMPIPEGKG